MLGNVVFFENVENSKDDVYNSRILPSNVFDKINQTMFRNYIWKLMHYHKKNVTGPS